MICFEIPPGTTIVRAFVTNAGAGQDGQFQFVDLQATNFPQRFYRITASQ